MKTHVVFAVAKRDLRSWFGNPVGYLFIVAFVASCAGVLMWSKEFFTNNLANLDTLNFWFPAIALGFVAAVTMGTWNSERSNGTQELLFTLPTHDTELLLGKFLAGVGVYTASLVFLLTVPFGLSLLGSPDWGQIVANFLGFWLVGVMLVAVTMLGSVLFDNLAVAFVVGGLAGATVMYSGWLLAVLTGSPAWDLNGPRGQFLEFGRGMVGPAGVLLFVGLAVAFLYLNLAILSRRHWQQPAPQLAHGTVRFASLAVAAVAITLLGVQWLQPLDSTFERTHSLSAESKKLLGQLDANRTVLVTAFVSKDVPEELVAQKRNLLNLLDQFDRIGGAAVEKDVRIVEQFSADAEDAEKNYGIQPRMRRSEEGGELRTWTVFLGFSVRCGTEEVSVPFADPGLPLEYELTRSIRTVANQGRKKVGILKTDVELLGGMDFGTFRQKPRWAICDELQQQYKVEAVDAAKDYPEDVDVLLVPQPNTLGPAEMDRLKAHIAAGRATLLLEDPAPMDAWRTSIDDKKGGTSPQDMFGGNQGEPKGDLVAMLREFGIAYQRAEVVWDTSSRTRFGGALPFLEIVFLGGAGISQDQPITRGLQQIVMLWGGHIKPAAKDGLRFEPLLRMPNPADGGERNGRMPKLQAFQFDAPWESRPQPNPNARHTPSNEEFTIAARVTGKPAEGQKQGVNLIYVADLDLISNQMFDMRRQMRNMNLQFDNVPFILNCIDQLAGDESLLELRKRQPVLRKLTAVEAAQKSFEDEWQRQREAAEEESKKELDAAQARLDEAVQKVKDDQSLDEQAKAMQIAIAQENENNRLTLAKAQIEQKKQRAIERAAHQREQDRRSIHNGFRFLTLLLTPIPALLFGFYTLVRRRGQQARIVPKNRMVVGGAS
ncbi:MAG: Gldg family protein [Planctomycetes bacterium]|nr:Gldg family protein [Planctomycetota bacterium]